MKPVRNTPILLVDDDEDCRLIIRDCIEESQVEGDIFEVTSGEEALAFISNEAPYEDAPRPGLIYLDIDMPGIDGVEVLQSLKEDKKTKDIPVVMLTALDDEETMLKVAKHGANSYYVKSNDPLRFFETVKRATDLWLNRPDKVAAL
ncbi:two-component system response regulator [candidate division LCP-89 bacterium B3_LCP]|uniref:Two-component system response regulator n=1 Tax=candidate division LCP-89 bacterium B3_LCP TaxID=2012998 RepID=A0A532V0N3_UNCL8|nr:MAG: two-component system response regulator [candidate division LCP-89 bacterium B3_LCP]